MKLEASLYDGDSIIRHGPTTSRDPFVDGTAIDPAPILSRRDEAPFGPDAGVIDIFAIEARARALRAAAVADFLTRFWTWRFWTWLGAQFSPDRARRRREEEYVARANFCPFGSPDHEQVAGGPRASARLWRGSG